MTNCLTMMTTWNVCDIFQFWNKYPSALMTHQQSTNSLSFMKKLESYEIDFYLNEKSIRLHIVLLNFLAVYWCWKWWICSLQDEVNRNFDGFKMMFQVDVLSRLRTVQLLFFSSRLSLSWFFDSPFLFLNFRSSLPLLMWLLDMVLANCKVAFYLCFRRPYLWKWIPRLPAAMMHDQIRRYFHYLLNGSKKKS